MKILYHKSQDKSSYLRDITLGIFSDTSEAVVSALKKAYARKSRSFLRWLMKKEGITESELLKELERIRK